MSEDLYQQEFECSWTAAIRGTYYGDLINKAREEGRICRLPIESKVPVHTFWDLGRNDSTCIWFMQSVGPEKRFVDYYECSGEGLDHYARILKDRAYHYGDHYLPHDVDVTELTSNKSRRDVLEALGVRPIRVVPRISHINEGIEMVRQEFAACWFDEVRCDYGIRCLESYRKDFDEARQVYRSTPLHDWSSHGADAFRMFAQGWRGASPWKQTAKTEPSRRERKQAPQTVNWMV